MADQTQILDGISYGAKDTAGDGTRYSYEVHLTGGSVNLEAADIQIGAVEIKDGDSDVRLDVELVTLKNAAHTQSESGGHPDLADVKTAIELLDHLTAANAGNADANTQRVVVATDDVNLAAIKTAVEILDNIVSGSEAQVDIVTQPAHEQTTPTFYNLTLTSADTEYVQALPANTRALQFQCRTAYDIRYAFETGKVATPTSPYSTLKNPSVWYKENILTSGSLYLASSEAGVIVEIETWS